MKREGSPFKGMATVALKEAADHMTSARMHLIMLLVLLTAIGAVFGAIGRITATTAEDPFLFLKLLTVAREPLPSFAGFLGFLLPLVAITLGFDAVNGEYARRMKLNRAQGDSVPLIACGKSTDYASAVIKG